jgi:hypothetical protein
MMAAPRATVGSVDALNRLTACPACGSKDLTPAGSLAGVADVLALSSMSVPVGTSKALPPVRKCKTCGWAVEATA